MKHTVTLEIAGTRFRLVADAEADHLQALAREVNDRVEELSAGSRTASSAQLLAMVALGLVDDLRTSEDKLKRLEAVTRDTIEQAIARIDEQLQQQPEPSEP